MSISVLFCVLLLSMQKPEVLENLSTFNEKIKTFFITIIIVVVIIFLMLRIIFRFS